MNYDRPEEIVGDFVEGQIVRVMWAVPRGDRWGRATSWNAPMMDPYVGLTLRVLNTDNRYGINLSRPNHPGDYWFPAVCLSAITHGPIRAGEAARMGL